MNGLKEQVIGLTMQQRNDDRQPWLPQQISQLHGVVIGKQPLLRRSIGQVAHRAGYQGVLTEWDSLTDYQRRLAAEPAPGLLIAFKDLGDAYFSSELQALLQQLSGKPKLVVLSETLGQCDRRLLSENLIDLYLPTSIGLSEAQNCLQHLFNAHPQRELESGLLDQFQDSFMPDLNDLTETERRVVAHLQRGLCNDEIAVCMQVSLCVIKRHMHEISKKLSANGRLSIATLACRQSFLMPNI